MSIKAVKTEYMCLKCGKKLGIVRGKSSKKLRKKEKKKLKEIKEHECK